MNNYEGSAYIGVVGPEMDYGPAWQSILAIHRREGDAPPAYARGTKGYETRQMHIDSFMASKHNFLLMLDHDMIFPEDTLERLRSHRLPFVSGLYMRRQYQPLAPIWFEDNPENYWPSQPWTRPIQRGKLHKIGASGWGCVLVHREVIQQIKPILKGEQEVIEDDMDIWPYDLDRVMRALNLLNMIATMRPENKDKALESVARINSVLQSELRLLTGHKKPVGSDIRFPFFAKQAGYQLWGDPDVECKHMINYALAPSDYAALDASSMVSFQQANEDKVKAARQEWKRHVGNVGGVL